MFGWEKQSKPSLWLSTWLSTEPVEEDDNECERCDEDTETDRALAVLRRRRVTVFSPAGGPECARYPFPSEGDEPTDQLHELGRSGGVPKGRERERERHPVLPDANSAHLEIKDDSAPPRLSVSYYLLGYRRFVTLTYGFALCLMCGCTPVQPAATAGDWIGGGLGGFLSPASVEYS